MAFPSSLPSYAGFTSTNTLAVDNHAAQHNQEQADITAVATKIGTGASTPTSGNLLRGNGTGTSTWAQAQLSSDVTGVLGTNNGGTGQSNLTGLTLNTPTLTQPTIADFTNATHDHSSTAKGGATLAPTSLTTNTIAASGANHITISAGASKLVKSTVLRQDDTTNTYQVGNSVMLTGWGVITGSGSASVTEVVNFGITFSQNPVVVLVYGGDAVSSTTYGAGTVNDAGAVTAWAHSVEPNQFTARLQRATGSWSSPATVFYQWMATGEI